MNDDPNEPSEPYREVRDGGGGVIGWAAAIIVVALFVVIGLVLFMAGRGPEPVEEATVADVADASEAPTGDSVTVEGEVGEVLTEQTLTISDGESGEQLLVLVPQTALVNGVAPAGGMAPASQLLAPEGPVEVLGTVESFDRDAMAEELGIVLNEELFGSWEGDRVLVADRIDSIADLESEVSSEPSDPADAEAG